MSRAVRFHEIGDADVLKIEDIEVGEPGEGEVRLRVQAVGLNRAEVMFRGGYYLEQPSLPSGIGYEGAGVVEAIGPGVSEVAVGDEVGVAPAFSMTRYSLLAEHAIVPVHAVTPRPAGLDAVHTAAIWMQYLTAYGALIDIGGLQAGESVIIPAASSSVGLAAIQIANSVGARPIATTRTQDKVERLRQAGAAHVIVTDEEDLVAEVMRVTGEAGARMVFDPVGGPAVSPLAEAMSPHGIMFLYGALASGDTPFPLFAALGKQLTLRGYTVLEIFADAERFARGKNWVIERLANGDLSPIIDCTFDFEEAADAYRYMESNQQFGKIVVKVSD